MLKAGKWSESAGIYSRSWNIRQSQKMGIVALFAFRLSSDLQAVPEDIATSRYLLARMG